ncbi:FkbM family methyltransferase [Pseudomonadota bacterium]
MPSWFERMQLTRSLGFDPHVILDGGAFRGHWSRDVSRIFPGAQIVLVEPNPHVFDEIDKNISTVKPSPKIIRSALGREDGSATFNLWREESSDTSASLLEHVAGEALNQIEVQVKTIDGIMQELGLTPDLIKLDLQGGELNALLGAEQSLKAAELCLIEFSCLDAYIDRATPRDLMEIMYANDYCLYDIVDCHYRPYDGAMTGGDFMFVRNSSVLRHYKGWE